MNAAPFPIVSVVTAHGRQPLVWRDGERLFDLLNRNGIAWSAVSAYVLAHAGGEPILTPCLDTRLSEYHDAKEILLYFNRNVNPFIFSLTDFKVVESADRSTQATEYLYQRLDNSSSSAQAYLKKLDPEECQSIIADRVADAARASIPKGAHVVVGVSGGGDSNALLHGFSRLQDHPVIVHPVIIKGIPDWDKGVPRAQALCEKYGLPITVLEESEVRDVLGLPQESLSLIDRFEREFPGDDFEFIGTLLIRLALRRHAQKIGTSFICTGLNLEDLLCENLFRVSNGLGPAAVPARLIGDVTLVLPLWLCPKRILDGCFPKYSLENYDARYPCVSLGRNLYYSVVYNIQSQFPGFAEQMARGFSQLADAHPIEYKFDDQLGFHVERFIPFPLRQRFLRMLGRA